MKTTPSQPRDTRLDVLRALALITIFVNHVPGNPFEPLTHKNFGFSDAAEAFVLIAGISAGFAYGAKFDGAALLITLKAWRRAGVLYIAQLGTTMATLGIFSFVAIHFSAPHILERINIRPVLQTTPEALVGIVTLGHQLGYNNILSMYAIILLIVPAFLLVGRYSLGWMVALSGVLWLVAGLLPLAPASYPNAGFWFLNPFSWQFLFVLGMAATLHVKRGGTIPVTPWLIGAAALYAALALLWVRVPLWGIDVSFGLPKVLTGFNKTFLSAPRLLHVLSVAYLIYALPRVSGLFRLAPQHPLTVLGRQALPVFVAGTILSMAAQAWRGVFAPTLAGDLAIVTAGLAAQFALAYWIEWYRRLASGSVTAPDFRLGPPSPPVPAKLRNTPHRR